MLKKVLILAWLIPVYSWAQTETYRLPVTPWTGDWLSAKVNQMVLGEEYMGFPGPLAKFFYAMGHGFQHPALTYEIKYIFDPAAPGWYGQCDGWSCAATRYPEPGEVVIHGIKFLKPELKALLSTIWMDSIVHSYTTDSGAAMSPLTLEETLFLTIAKGKPLIMDADQGVEAWNYPISAFTISSSSSDEWTYVNLDVTLIDSQGMIYQTDDPVTFHEKYSYRKKEGGIAEWLSANKPGLLWDPLKPYFAGMWMMSSDRYINDGLYQKFMDSKGDYRDFSEPNDETDHAFPLQNKSFLGCLPDGDIDFFIVPTANQAPVRFNVSVYDGTEIELSLYNGSGTELVHFDSFLEHEVVWIPEDDDGIIVKVNAATESSDPIFYKLIFPLEQSGFLPPVPGATTRLTVTEKIINSQSSDQKVIFNGQSELPGYSVMPLPLNRTTPVLVDAVTTLSRSLEFEGKQAYKKYSVARLFQGDYTIPHLAFKNSWVTRLQLLSSRNDGWVSVKFFKGDGSSGGSILLNFTEGALEFNITEFIQNSNKLEVAWCQLHPEPGLHIDGFVVYEREDVGDKVRVPIESAPKIGEVAFCDLKTADEGWNGVAMVNTSLIENEILFKLVNRQGLLKKEGTFTLAPGEKKLNTVSGLTGTSVEHGDVLIIFSHYQIDYLNLVHQWSGGVRTYGNRAGSIRLDAPPQASMLFPQERERLYFLICNATTAYQFVLFEGYDLAGKLQGRFNVEIGNAIDPFETMLVPIDQILENGVQVGDIDKITSMRISCPDGVLIWEMDLNEANKSFDSISLPSSVSPLSYSKRQNDPVQYELTMERKLE